MALRDTWEKTLVYFGLADDPEAARRATVQRDAATEQLEALERRVHANTEAIEALRAEIMRLSAKL